MLTLKKELDRLDNDHRNMKKDLKEQGLNYDLLMDQFSKIWMKFPKPINKITNTEV
jgi:hypothetical protein